MWIPKYRQRILNLGVSEYLEKLFPKIIEQMPGCEIITCNIQIDHIHMVMVIPPKYAVSKIIGKIKANTGYKLRQKYKFLDQVYWGVEGIWSIGYFVSTVGINESVIRKYIENQEQEDSGQAKLEF